jgi:hypothetical protein
MSCSIRCWSDPQRLCCEDSADIADGLVPDVLPNGSVSIEMSASAAEARTFQSHPSDLKSTGLKVEKAYHGRGTKSISAGGRERAFPCDTLRRSRFVCAGT